MTDPVTGHPEGSPYLAVDLQPDNLAGVFTLDASSLDGADRLGWEGAEGEWINVVCNVQRVQMQRGVSRLQGVLTRAEAGEITLTVEDVTQELDPLTAGENVHKGTPLRLRAWAYQDALVWEETRRNRVPNPRAATAATSWTVNAGTGGTAAVARVAGAGPGGVDCVRATWTVASTATGSGQLRADGRAAQPLPIPVVPGESLTAAMQVRASIAQRLALVLTYFDAAGAQTGITPTSNAGTAAVVVANTWTPLTIGPVTVPPGTAYVLVGPQAVAGSGAVVWPIGATLEGTLALLGSGTYFDGDTADDPGTAEGDTRYSWAGTAHASQSVEETVYTDLLPSSTVLFTGEVDELAVEYRPQDAPLVTITGVDLIGPLAAWESEGRAGDGDGTGDTLLGRVQRVQAECGIGGTAADSDATFAATLNPSTLARPWQNISDAADAELGRVWADRDNLLVCRGRYSELSGPVRGTLSDVHGEAPTAPHCCMAAASVVFGVESLGNRALAARRPLAAEDPAAAVQVRRDDTYSQARYGTGTVERTVELQTQAQVAPWAEAVVLAGSRPELRVDSVTPAPDPDDVDAALEAWLAVLSTDIGDRWLFRYHPVYGSPVQRTLGVLGMTMALTPEEWTVTWATTEAPTPGAGSTAGWLVLDASELDGGDLLAPYSQPLPAPV